MRSTTIHQRETFCQRRSTAGRFGSVLLEKSKPGRFIETYRPAVDIISILFNAWLKACVLEFNAKATYNGASGLHLRLLSNATGPWDSLRGTIMISLMQHFLTDTVE